mgnify:CR=1 FL=1
MKGNTTTVKIYGTFTKSAPVNIKFTYQAYNSTFEQVTCKGMWRTLFAIGMVQGHVICDARMLVGLVRNH